MRTLRRHRARGGGYALRRRLYPTGAATAALWSLSSVQVRWSMILVQDRSGVIRHTSTATERSSAGADFERVQDVATAGTPLDFRALYRRHGPELVVLWPLLIFYFLGTGQLFGLGFGLFHCGSRL